METDLKEHKLTVEVMNHEGDVVRTLPAVSALRAGLPEAQITWLVEPVPSSILAGQPWIDAAAGLPVLTVGEADNFTRDGGIISFYAQGTKIRFEINKQVAENAGLRISSRLLRLARIVSSEGE